MKKINIAELLKDCPPGMELDCTLYNTKVIYQGLNKRIPTHPIVVQTEHGFEFELTQYGQIHNIVGSKCVIFPKGKTTWEGFVPPGKFKDGDILYVESDNHDSTLDSWILIYKENENEEWFYKYVALKNHYSNNNNIVHHNGPICYKKDISIIRFATEEEKEKLFKELKHQGYRWNNETKTLKKLIEPKFKVGDVVQDQDGYKVKITEVEIDDEYYGYLSKILRGIGSFSFKDQDNWELVPNKKEETMEETNKVIFEGNAHCCDIMNDIIKDDMETITIDDFKANTKEWLIDKLESISKDNALQSICNIHKELHKSQYPKTYEECCDILGYKASYDLNNITTHDCVYDYKLQMLYRVLICRDAYWKIAGEQRGLEKSWEPDYDSGVNKYGIICMNGVVQKSNPTTNWERHLNKVLDFPTQEMRDAFFENFKDLIEACKELL